MLDLAVRNGFIVDGSGAEGFRADLGISNGRIAELGRVSGAEAEVDASKRVVCPGSIDVNSHSDLTLLVDPLAQSKVRQGVTTEVVGNCGFGVAPLRNERLREFVNFWTGSGSEWYGLKPR